MWPEGDVFGSAEVQPEEELELLKQILFAELPSKLVIQDCVICAQQDLQMLQISKCRKLTE